MAGDGMSRSSAQLSTHLTSAVSAGHEAGAVAGAAQSAARSHVHESKPLPGERRVATARVLPVGVAAVDHHVVGPKQRPQSLAGPLGRLAVRDVEEHYPRRTEL